MSNKSKWEALSMKDRAFLMREGIRNGITDLNEIRDLYNQSHKFSGEDDGWLDKERIVRNVPAREWGPWYVNDKEEVEGTGTRFLDAITNYFKDDQQLGQKNIDLANAIITKYEEKYPGKKTGNYEKDVEFRSYRDAHNYLDHVAALQKYLGLSYDTSRIHESKYKPKGKETTDEVFYTFDTLLDNMPPVVEDMLNSGSNKKQYKDPILNTFTAYKDRDNKGDFISIYDTWDYNPKVEGGPKWLNSIIDTATGGTPFNIYDRIYLDDHYNVPEEHQGGHYIQPIIVTPEHVFSGEENLAFADPTGESEYIIDIPEVTITAQRPRLTSREDYKKLGEYTRALRRGEIERENIPFKFRVHLPKSREQAQEVAYSNHKGQEQFNQIMKEKGWDTLEKAYGVGMSSAIALPVLSSIAGSAASAAAAPAEQATVQSSLSALEAANMSAGQLFMNSFFKPLFWSTVGGGLVDQTSRLVTGKPYGQALYDAIAPDSWKNNPYIQQYGPIVGDFLNPGYLWSGPSKAAVQKAKQLFGKKGTAKTSSKNTTYDDFGNVIPLSQRDNFTNPDFRYQKTLNVFEPSQQTRSYLTNGEYTGNPSAIQPSQAYSLNGFIKKLQKGNYSQDDLELANNIQQLLHNGELYYLSDVLPGYTEQVLSDIYHQPWYKQRYTEQIKQSQPWLKSENAVQRELDRTLTKFKDNTSEVASYVTKKKVLDNISGLHAQDPDNFLIATLNEKYGHNYFDIFEEAPSAHEVIHASTGGGAKDPLEIIHAKNKAHMTPNNNSADAGLVVSAEEQRPRLLRLKAIKEHTAPQMTDEEFLQNIINYHNSPAGKEKPYASEIRQLLDNFDFEELVKGMKYALSIATPVGTGIGIAQSSKKSKKK